MLRLVRCSLQDMSSSACQSRLCGFTRHDLSINHDDLTLPQVSVSELDIARCSPSGSFDT